MGKLTAAQKKWLVDLGAMVGGASADADADGGDAGPDAAALAAQREMERARRKRSRALDDIESELRLLRRSFR